jgi:ketosteroid isomerase-like protein
MITRFSGLAAFLLCTLSSIAEAQGILGANAGRQRKEAAEYRERMRSEVMELIGELGEKWDDADPGKPARYYDKNATIVLGPNRSVQGRQEIRGEFAKTLSRMHGVLFTMEDYDLSGDLIFIRGTMSYELIRNDAPATRGLRFICHDLQAAARRVDDTGSPHRWNAAARRRAIRSCGGVSFREHFQSLDVIVRG